jgi:hypothetical protein
MIARSCCPLRQYFYPTIGKVAHPRSTQANLNGEARGRRSRPPPHRDHRRKNVNIDDDDFQSLIGNGS